MLEVRVVSTQSIDLPWNLESILPDSRGFETADTRIPDSGSQTAFRIRTSGV